MSSADAPAFSGGLITPSFAATGLQQVRGAGEPPSQFVTAIDRWHERVDAGLGPASSTRAIAEAAVLPLLRLLGYQVSAASVVRAATYATYFARAHDVAVPVAVATWGEPLDRAWRGLVLDGIGVDARWAVCCNGVALRVVDAVRTWARFYLEFELARLTADADARRLLWSVLRADAMATRPPVLETAAALSARQGSALCRTLARGVRTALDTIYAALAARAKSTTPVSLFDESLTVVYRVLFLLFAEARGLVPVWHPIYRDRYSIGAIVGRLEAGRPCRGLWHAIQAISRLAHAGCSAGGLTVTAFNGRLFAPAGSTAFDRTRIADGPLSDAILAVSTTTSPGKPRMRISYRELDVEQLGAVYETVLEHEPSAAPGAPSGRSDARKTTASFYTPRALTSWLVAQTLAPLVENRTSDEILRLRIVDPAMGSGAFLIACCRYLAAAAEEALVREGRWHPGDITAPDRALLRRQIAQRCLFGVDLNPMAVQLARLSLWLTTLAADKPLTFLDHHLVVGNSLLGATPADVQRQPPGRTTRRTASPLPLFDDQLLQPVVEYAAQARLQLALRPDDSASDVRDKERQLAALDARGSALSRWREVLSLWCACWFWHDGARPSPPLFAALCDHLLQRPSSLASHVAEPWLERARAIAEAHRFLHWPLAFPEVFFDAQGQPRPDAGFDAVVGNPPWDMVRGDSGDRQTRRSRRDEARQLTAFTREAGIYRAGTRAHVNRYQLFLERAMQIVRPGGRIGMVLPGGLLVDAGAASVRRLLLDRAELDHVAGFDNRRGIFPIHRSVRFALVTCTTGRATTQISCRFGLKTADDLQRSGTPHLIVTRRLLERISGADDLGLPEITDARDLAILERVTARVPWLGASDGWSARFGRELNATDDRERFVPFDGSPGCRPVLEGRQIEPFRASVAASCHALPPGVTVAAAPHRQRLAYRDVASPGNRLTLIAAIIPARAVTTHTLFCLKSPLPVEAQHVLSGLMNSLVANYLIRMRVSTHVTVSLVSRLPVPLVRESDPHFARLLTLSRTLATGSQPAVEMPEYAELQALVAGLYHLTHDDFARVLETFPLLTDEMKHRALRLFDDLH